MMFADCSTIRFTSSFADELCSSLFWGRRISDVLLRASCMKFSGDLCVLSVFGHMHA